MNWPAVLLRVWPAALLGALLPLAGEAMTLVHSERSLYRQVLIYEDAGTRYLCFTRNCTIGRQSALLLHDRERLVFEYAHMMLGSLFLAPEPRSILIIGLGGGSLPRALRHVLPTVHIDAVEIDPAVTKVARDYFYFRPDERMAIAEEDGRIFVKKAVRAGRKYDLIMLDAYDHEYIPEHLLTEEFLREVRSLLPTGGVLAANTFSASRLYDSESVTYQKVYGSFYNLKSGNRIILTRIGGLPAMDEVRRNAERFDRAFKPFGFTSREVLGLFSTQTDWDVRARVLTDQYSPANLLNSAP